MLRGGVPADHGSACPAELVLRGPQRSRRRPRHRRVGEGHQRDAGGQVDHEFSEFVAAQTRPLLGLAHALTADPHDAWDLTQETLARMGERWGRSRFDEPAAYARTVMTRLNIDRVRRLRRELPMLSTREEQPPVVVTGELDGWLVEALATLSPRQRTALALRYVEDLDVRGIAERMGCSEGTVKSQLSRGTERLREHAREHGPLRTAVGREDWA
nr:SigE family RNA polymerase sigma factor [Nocardioides sp. MAH-18]